MLRGDVARLVVLASGEGTNLQAIIDACSQDVLRARVVHVLSDVGSSGALRRAGHHGIAATHVDPTGMARAHYDMVLAARVHEAAPDLVVLAGWMRVLGSQFLERFLPAQVVNLHPALPGAFPGTRAIERAYRRNGNSGVMVHEVVAEVDAGPVVQQLAVPRYEDDTLESFRLRMKAAEHAVLVPALQVQLTRLPRLLRRGKVRDIYAPGADRSALALVTTDRCSAFDRHVCTVPGKGVVVAALSAWWMAQTLDIVRNHMLRHVAARATTFVRRLAMIPVEFVVRDFITGSTSTSMWTLYERGQRVFGGVELPDGLAKHARLAHAVVTPTTKERHDRPTTRDDLVSAGVLTAEAYDFCATTALRLFAHGQAVAARAGLILVDSKYEFGYGEDGSIVLGDEMHTPECSRYWDARSYYARGDGDPVCYDKEFLRLWLARNREEREVPADVVAELGRRYVTLYERLVTKPPPRSAEPLNGHRFREFLVHQ